MRFVPLCWVFNVPFEVAQKDSRLLKNLALQCVLLHCSERTNVVKTRDGIPPYELAASGTRGGLTRGGHRGLGGMGVRGGHREQGGLGARGGHRGMGGTVV
jgi:hypothetical protein